MTEAPVDYSMANLSGTFYAVVEGPDDTNPQFGAWFPQAPGCTTQADTEGELLSNCLLVLSMHFEQGEEDRSKGDSRLLDRLVLNMMNMSQAEAEGIAEVDIAEGAYILAVPYEHKVTSIVTAKL